MKSDNIEIELAEATQKARTGGPEAEKALLIKMAEALLIILLRQD